MGDRVCDLSFRTVTHLLSSFYPATECMCMSVYFCQPSLYCMTSPPSVWMQVFGNMQTPAENVSFLDILSDPIPDKHYKESEVSTCRDETHKPANVQTRNESGVLSCVGILSLKHPQYIHIEI